MTSCSANTLSSLSGLGLEEKHLLPCESSCEGQRSESGNKYKDESSPGAPGNSRAVDAYATMQTRGRSFAHQTPQMFCRNPGALRGRRQCAEAAFTTVIASKAVVVDPTFLPNHFLPLVIQGQIVVAAGLAGSFSLSLSLLPAMLSSSIIYFSHSESFITVIHERKNSESTTRIMSLRA